MVTTGSSARGLLARMTRLTVPLQAGTLLVAITLAFAACRKDDPRAEAVRRGREAWLTATFGGERFFGELLSQPPFSLPIGLDVLLTADRDTRFDEFGAINDPDCERGDASTGGYDRCPDPHASGVVGVRRFDDPQGGPPRLGVTCAACHAGLDPEHPPVDPNHPGWDDIDLTVGNQYLDIGRIFRAHLSPADPRHQVFRSWAPGTVDTTVLESDHINNPSIITPIQRVADRPYFDVTVDDEPRRVHRSGFGGEDDAGCEAATMRVYLNIGMCAAECVLPHLANGPGGGQTPIDLVECRERCPAFARAEAAAPDICAFLDTARQPLLAHAPGGADLVDHAAVAHGQRVFERACASCHSEGGLSRHDVLSDDLVHPIAEIGTHPCRVRTTNWTEGHVWAAFSSDQYKARPTGGPGFARDVPLIGLWAQAPFLHNNRLGPWSGDPSVRGRVAAYEAAMAELLDPSKRDLEGSIQRTDHPVEVGGRVLPVGTPIVTFASRDPARPGVNPCPEAVENGGHVYGSTLSAEDKRALTEFLKTR
jgi:hypothetical protein